MVNQNVLAHRREAHLWLLDALFAIVAAYAIAVSAQLRVTLPWTPVPVTMQTFTVLTLGALAGRRRGVLATLTYMVAGGLGLPLFAGGTLWGPTGGYLIGFVGAAFVLGTLMRLDRFTRGLGLFVAVLTANVVIYAFGLPWLARFVGIESMLPLGLFPFAVGDLIKSFSAATVAECVRHLDGHGRS